MIKYNLICKCGKTFESWFSSSNEYEILKKRNLLIVFIVTIHLLKKLLWRPIYLASQIK